jgi:MFS family permease
VRLTQKGEPVASAHPDTETPAGGVLPFIVAGTFFMEYLDTTVIATALAQIARSFSVGPNEVSLGMTAYMLTLAVFIPVSGWIAARAAACRAVRLRPRPFTGRSRAFSSWCPSSARSAGSIHRS